MIFFFSFLNYVLRVVRMKIVIRLERGEFVEDGKIWKIKNGKKELVSILPDDEEIVIE